MHCTLTLIFHYCYTVFLTCRDITINALGIVFVVWRLRRLNFHEIIYSIRRYKTVQHVTSINLIHRNVNILNVQQYCIHLVISKMCTSRIWTRVFVHCESRVLFTEPLPRGLLTSCCAQYLCRPNSALLIALLHSLQYKILKHDQR